MLLHMLKTITWRYLKSSLTTLGGCWLVLDPAIALSWLSVPVSYGQLLLCAGALAVVYVFVDGLWFSGYLRTCIHIKSNGFDTKITVRFANLFDLDGWKAIGVNDFFDSKVDEHHVSSGSLHGICLQKYWGGNTDEWDKQVYRQLAALKSESVPRESGKVDRYDIGTTVTATKGDNKLLFVALTHTDVATLQTKASSSDLNRAVRGLLTKARSVCANEPLNIPLMGSGLARTGIKSNILVDLILTAVFEETKLNKVTDEIRIVLPKDRISEINLTSLKQDWS